MPLQPPRALPGSPPPPPPGGAARPADPAEGPRGREGPGGRGGRRPPAFCRGTGEGRGRRAEGKKRSGARGAGRRSSGGLNSAFKLLLTPLLGLPKISINKPLELDGSKTKSSFKCIYPLSFLSFKC